MPSYPYRCRLCGDPYLFVMSVTEHDHFGLRCHCGGELRRVWTVPYVLKAGFMETHFNHTTGSVVTNMADFREQLKIKSDQMSERLGFEQRLVPVDPDQPKALGVTPDGLEGKDNFNPALF